jgi:hypothetical protein
MLNELRSQGNWNFWRSQERAPLYRPIAAEDVKSLRLLLEKIGGGDTAFLQFMGVARVEDILQYDFPKAVNALRGKLRGMGQ